MSQVFWGAWTALKFLCWHELVQTSHQSHRGWRERPPSAHWTHSGCNEAITSPLTCLGRVFAKSLTRFGVRWVWYSLSASLGCAGQLYGVTKTGLAASPFRHLSVVFQHDCVSASWLVNYSDLPVLKPDKAIANWLNTLRCSKFE